MYTHGGAKSREISSNLQFLISVVFGKIPEGSGRLSTFAVIFKAYGEGARIC